MLGGESWEEHEETQEEHLHAGTIANRLTHVFGAVTEYSCNDCESQAAAAMEGEGSSERLAAALT
jgi:hypothetical protein